MYGSYGNIYYIPLNIFSDRETPLKVKVVEKRCSWKGNSLLTPVDLKCMHGHIYIHLCKCTFVYSFSIYNILQPLNSYVFVQLCCSNFGFASLFAKMRYIILVIRFPMSRIGYINTSHIWLLCSSPIARQRKRIWIAATLGGIWCLGLIRLGWIKQKPQELTPKLVWRASTNIYCSFLFWIWNIKKMKYALIITWFHVPLRLGRFDNSQQLFELYDKLSLKRFLPRVFD